MATKCYYLDNLDELHLRHFPVRGTKCVILSKGTRNSGVRGCRPTSRFWMELERAKLCCQQHRWGWFSQQREEDHRMVNPVIEQKYREPLTMQPLRRFCSSFTSFPMTLCESVPTALCGSCTDVRGSASSLAGVEPAGATAVLSLLRGKLGG